VEKAEEDSGKTPPKYRDRPLWAGFRFGFDASGLEVEEDGDVVLVMVVWAHGHAKVCVLDRVVVVDWAVGMCWL
jgi:hypothetical protein